MNSLTLAINLSNGAPSQYTNFDYDGFADIGGEIIGGGQSGIHRLEKLSHDQDQIDAYFKTGLIDFDIENQKRIRSAVLGCETENDMQVKIIDDEDDEESVTLTFDKNSLKLASAKRYSVRKQVGRYYQFKISNIDGSQFSVEDLSVVLIVLASKPRGK